VAELQRHMKSPATCSVKRGSSSFRFVPSHAGLMYEVVHLVAELRVVRLGQSMIRLLERDYPSRALATPRGLRTLSRGVMAPPLAVDPSDGCVGA
jgi:hypothetical protein